MASMESSGIPNLSSSVSKQSFESSAAQASSLSSSVASVVRELSSHRDVSASQIVASLLEYHKDDYARGRARRFRLPEDASGSDRRPVAEWIDAVRSLYVQKMIPKLHGRLVILGLSMLDWELAKELAANDFLKTLQGEVYPSFDTLLTSNGNQSWLGMLDYVNPPVRIDTVPTYLDHPTKDDKLGRRVFAESLALRIRTIRNEEIKAGDKGCFRIHIGGPWGSGKTTLLNFLRAELESEDVSLRWVVVEFNAWEHQRLGRPWWWLMNAVYQQGAQQLRRIGRWHSVKFRLKEYLWRFSRTGWPPYLVALFALALAFWIIWLVGSRIPLQPLSQTAQSMSAIVALILTIWGVVFGISRSLLQGSASAASTFMESTRDPMKTLTRHFNSMISSLKVFRIKLPVAIFIDDLDRCQGSYVVELLEGIQTLFSEARVTYVISADRRWIQASYEKAYDSFAGAVGEPGRPLRYIFLDKVFHLSTSVPAMTPTAQADYWRNLLRISQSEYDEKLRKAKPEAEEEMQKLHTEKEILELIQRVSGGSDPIKEQAVRKAAVKRLAAPEVAKRTEHDLQDFAPLLEPNPRAMKRLLTAYADQRAIATLVGVNIVMKQLALWTIVVLRWPLLAEYLEDHPEMVGYIGGPVQDSIPEDLHKLFGDEEVHGVIRGKDVGISLDESAIRSCAYLRA